MYNKQKTNTNNKNTVVKILRKNNEILLFSKHYVHPVEIPF